MHKGMGQRSASIAPHLRNSTGSPKHSNYLKRGKGSGGSPTQFEVMEDANSQLRFERRHQSVISYRMRNHSGAYTMIGGESTQQLSNAPTIKADLERRKFL